MPSPPQRVLLLRDRLIVAAIDSLFSFSPDLQLLDLADASPSPSRREKCEVYDAHQPALCRNFLRVVQSVNGSTLLVCGTNAVFPKCRLVELQNLSSWVLLTAEGRKDVGFSPHTDDGNVAVLADNGAFFTATSFNFRQTQQTIGLAPSLEEAEFSVRTPSFIPSWLNDPVFLSAYDEGDHVYLFAREPSYEVGGGLVVSRVIRVCKNDSGFQLFPGDTTYTFLTFQKARLRCRSTGKEESIPYDYDRLQGTYLYRPSNGGDPTLYATFSSPANGPRGSALCKFSLSELDSVFEGGEYLVQSKGGWKVEAGGSFACPGSERGGPERTEQQAKTQQLMSGVATASEPQPMVTVLGDDLLLLTADVVEYGGSQLEVVVSALGSREITQISWYRGSIYRHTIGTMSSPVTNMVLHRNSETEERQVLLTTNSSVQSVSLGKCSRYDTCFECFDSHDPYCAWRGGGGSGECVNKLTTASLLPDSLTSSEQTITAVCGSRSPTTTPPPSGTNPSSCPHNPGPPVGPSASDSDSPPTSATTGEMGVTPVGLDSREKERGEDAGLLAGASVGGFLLGIPVGLVICYLFFSVFLKKISRSGEEEGQGDTGREVNQLERFGVYEKQTPPNSTRYLDLSQRNPTTLTTKNVNQQQCREKEEAVISTDQTTHPISH